MQLPTKYERNLGFLPKYGKQIPMAPATLKIH